MAEKEKLTPAQKQAVEDRGGKLLVSAAAGSGKTKVLVDRLLSYVLDPINPANLDDFLIITYTKAAASELRSKIADKLSQRIAENPGNQHLLHQVQRLYLTKISTVHAFCSDLLRQYAYLVDVPMDFRVADETEYTVLQAEAMDTVLERAYAELEQRKNVQAFVDTQGLGRNDKTVPEILLRIYEASRCHLNPAGWLTDSVKQLQIDDETEIANTLWGKYLLHVLHEKAALSLKSMENCLQAAEKVEGFSKVCGVLQSDIAKLRDLAAAATWDEAAERTQMSFDKLTFPTKNNPDPELTLQIKAVREACKERIRGEAAVFTENSEKVKKDLQSVSSAVYGLVELISDFEKTYTSMKTGRRILDFSDLEHRTLDLLLGKKRDHITLAAKEIGSKFREIMVDEYQDSNGIQDAIFYALTEEKQNCFMVGDVKQSIYRFRLADPDIFMEKYHSYVPAENAGEGQGRKIHLSSNFRSGTGVIEAVNHVFRYCMIPLLGGMEYGDAEALVEGIPHVPIVQLESGDTEPETELYCIQVENQTYTQEAAFTAKRIKELLDGTHCVRDGDVLRPIRPEDIVILLRSPGSVGYLYQDALERLGIPSYFGTGSDLLKSEEIQVLRSLMETISNPAQDIPLIASMASPLFCFHADELAEIRGGRTNISFYDALKQADTIHTKAFLAVLKELRVELSVNGLGSLMKKLFTTTHIESIFGMRDDGEVRKANLRYFYELAMQFENSRQRGLEDFLEYLQILEERGIQNSMAQPGAGCVTIMSIHRSKGLEFPVVFLCGLSKAFNREDTRGRVQCDQKLGIGPSIVSDQLRIYYPSVPLSSMKIKAERESLWEELRVLYVAMTRARDRLIMVYTYQYLDNTLKKIAARLSLEGKELLLQEVKSMGEWVLLSALQRMEAGALFAVSGKYHEAKVSEKPWKITYMTATSEDLLPGKAVLPEEKTKRNAEDPDDFVEVKKSLDFMYPYLAASREPSKQTATQLKGREKDKESEENAEITGKRDLSWRKFAAKDNRALNYGNAMHRVMQYIALSQCGDVKAIRREILRMEDKGILTKEQAEEVNAKQIAAFFDSEIGKRIQSGRDVHREFKFSILQRGADTLSKEEVLLQGVVDCFYEDDGQITVIDFKTDHVTEDNLDLTAESYALQVKTYGNAVERIFGMPVTHKYLYFFRLNRFVEIM